jgi:hypothetical protein
MQGIRFRARGGDEAAARLAESLSADAALTRRWARSTSSASRSIPTAAR